jgi:hypothetical protein
MDGKTYVECGVQTSPPRILETPSTPQKSLIVPCIQESESASPAANSSPDSVGLQLNSSFSLSFNKDLSESSHPVRPKALVRRQRLPYNKPPESLKPEQRVVSLPELGNPLPCVNSALKAPSMRVVSLPECPHQLSEDSPSPIRFRSPVFKRSAFLFGDEERSSGYRRASSSLLLPQTPSPPSSPESSVLIIENDAQLPRTFLRNKRPLETHLECSDDDGLLTGYQIVKIY